MKKEEALLTFAQTELKAASQEFLRETMSFLEKEERKNTAKQFAQSIAHALKEASGLSYLQIVLMRSKALLGEPFYRFEAYGEKFYLLEPILAESVPLDWLYNAYRSFMKQLDQESKKYMGSVGEQELSRIKLAQLWTCQKIIHFLFFESLGYLLQTEEYEKLDAKKKIQFHLGEYRGEYEVLMTKDEKMEKIGGLFRGILLAEGT